MSDIFGNFNLQKKNAIYNFIKIEQKRVEIMKRRDEETCINVQNSLICYLICNIGPLEGEGKIGPN